MEERPQRLPLTLDVGRDGYQCREGQNYTEAVLICITARVGSTAFMSALAGLAGASELPEIFNPRGTFPTFQAEYQARSVQEYVNCFHAQSGAGERVWFKTNFFDLIGMVRPEGVARVFPRRKHIQIVRRDVVAQAYSLWKANKYNLWHARDGAARDAIGDVALDDPDDLMRISRTVGNLWRERCQWETFFRNNPGLGVLTLAFEDIADNLEGQVRRAWRFATGAEPPPGPIATDYVRTSNDEDAENIRRVKAALAAA